MRIWMLASLQLTVTAIGCDHGIEPPSQFLERVVATSRD